MADSRNFILFPGRGLRRGKRGFNGRGQISCRAAAPVVKEEQAWFFMAHMVMDGDNVDSGMPQRFEDGLQFVSSYHKIAIDDRIIVAAGKSGPGVDAHFFADFTAARHFGRAPKNGFEHSIFAFAFVAEQLLERGCAD